LSATELFRVDRPDFIGFVERRPKLAVRLMVVLCERLRWVSENIEDAIFLDVPRRLAKRLLLLAETYGRPSPGGGTRIAQELSQEN
ncbi:Crp/Fnr family transcriptional regulator, partial [bacterium]|nr:Crp/Fnr family transcriptional regulator [bacterium]